jgi:hypothetical protein
MKRRSDNKAGHDSDVTCFLIVLASHLPFYCLLNGWNPSPSASCTTPITMNVFGAVSFTMWHEGFSAGQR